mgnify:FL=1
MNREKFTHLIEMEPDAGKILNTPVELVDNDQLGTLWVHFTWIKDKFGDTNPEIADAANTIIGKINNIISWSNRSYISWETMKAANDDNYQKVA